MGNDSLTIIGRDPDSAYKIKPLLESPERIVEKLDKLVCHYKNNLPTAVGLFNPKFDACLVLQKENIKKYVIDGMHDGININNFFF